MRKKRVRKRYPQRYPKERPIYCSQLSEQSRVEWLALNENHRDVGTVLAHTEPKALERAIPIGGVEVRTSHFWVGEDRRLHREEPHGRGARVSYQDLLEMAAYDQRYDN